MKRFIFSLVMVSAVISVWSCATPPIAPRPDVPKILTALQDDINKAVQSIEPSLVYAEIGSGRNVFGMTGLVLSSSGEIMIPVYLKKDSYDRVEVWLSDNEYEASLVQSDERLRVSIIKINAETPLTPVNFAVVLIPSLTMSVSYMTSGLTVETVGMMSFIASASFRLRPGEYFPLPT